MARLEDSTFIMSEWDYDKETEVDVYDRPLVPQFKNVACESILLKNIKWPSSAIKNIPEQYPETSVKAIRPGLDYLAS